MLTKLFDRVDYLYMLRACWRAGERRKLVLVILLTLLQSMASLVQPYLQGRFIGAFMLSGSGMIHQVMLWLILTFVASLIAELLFRQSWIAENDYGATLEQDITAEFYDKAISLPWRWHQAHHSADVTRRISDGARGLVDFARNQATMWDVVFRFAGSLIAISLLNGWLTLVVIVWLPFINQPISRMSRKQSETRRKQNDASRDVSTGLTDYIGNAGTIIALKLQKLTGVELYQRIRRSTVLSRQGNKLVADRNFFISSSQAVFTFAVIVGYLLLKHDQTSAALVAAVVALQGYLTRVEQSVHGLGWLQQFSMTSRVQVKSADIIETAYAELDATATLNTDFDWKSLLLSHLTFRYEDQEHHIHQLADVSLQLRRGQRVALVGSSGSGKSTLLRLMRGLHDPASGSLTIDGAPAEFSTLANLSTLVLQDAEIFENTLRYNIAFGMEAEQADLDRAIRTSCLQPVLDLLPQGLETDIRERGVNLSGGQKQRLALARGLYAGRTSSLLLLDEPTSSLDTVTEAQIFDRLFADRPDACIVASLHRLHLLERFDHVTVMDQGRVVEQGTFAELMAANGKLTQLWQAQKREENAVVPSV